MKLMINNYLKKTNNIFYFYFIIFFFSTIDRIRCDLYVYAQYYGQLTIPSMLIG